MADLAREEGAASDDGEAEKKSELAPKEVEQEQPRSLLKAGQSSSFDASFASRTTAAPVPSLFPISGNVSNLSAIFIRFPKFRSLFWKLSVNL